MIGLREQQVMSPLVPVGAFAFCMRIVQVIRVLFAARGSTHMLSDNQHNQYELSKRGRKEPDFPKVNTKKYQKNSFPEFPTFLCL